MLRISPKLEERGVIFSGNFPFFRENFLVGACKGGVKGRVFETLLAKIDTQKFETQKCAKITRARLVGDFEAQKVVIFGKMPCRF